MLKVSCDRIEETLIFPLCYPKRKIKEVYRKMALRMHGVLLADAEIIISIENKMSAAAAA